MFATTATGYHHSPRRLCRAQLPATLLPPSYVGTHAAVTPSPLSFVLPTDMVCQHGIHSSPCPLSLLPQPPHSPHPPPPAHLRHLSAPHHLHTRAVPVRLPRHRYTARTCFSSADTPYRGGTDTRCCLYWPASAVFYTCLRHRFAFAVNIRHAWPHIRGVLDDAAACRRTARRRSDTLPAIPYLCLPAFGVPLSAARAATFLGRRN